MPVKRDRSPGPTYMTVDEAIAAADSILPGVVAPEGERDERWQALIAIGDFVETQAEAVWPFIVRWGVFPDEDLRTAVATLLLEHLLEYHFDEFILRVEEAAQSDPLFGDTISRCWKFGQAEEPSRAARFDRLVASFHRTG